MAYRDGASKPPVPTHRSQRRLALVVSTVSLLLLGTLVLLRHFLPSPPIIYPDRSCPEGRQNYQGTCVSNKMIDFLTCLKEHNATATLTNTNQVVRALGPNLSGMDDDKLRRRVQHDLLSIRKAEIDMVRQFCKDVADAGGIIVPVFPASFHEAFYRGQLLETRSAMPLANIKITLVGTSCSQSTNESGLFSFSECRGWPPTDGTPFVRFALTCGTSDLNVHDRPLTALVFYADVSRNAIDPCSVVGEEM